MKRVAVIGLLFAAAAYGQITSIPGATGGSGSVSLPITTKLLKGNNAGNAAAATSADVISLWNAGACTSGYLKFDGTCATPAGGGASLPASKAVIGSDGSGNGVAATYGSVVSLFGGGSCSGFIKSDGTCSSSTSTLPSYATSSVPATGTALQLVGVTDNTSGLPFYTYNTSGNAIKLLDIGPSGALDMSTPGQIDVNTGVIPRKGISETVTGLWGFTQGARFGAQTSCTQIASYGCLYWNNTDAKFHQVAPSGADSVLATSTTGQYYQTGQANGSAVTQRANFDIVAGNNVTVTPIDDSGNNVSRFRIDSAAPSLPSITDDGSSVVITSGTTFKPLTGDASIRLTSSQGFGNGDFFMSAYRTDKGDYAAGKLAIFAVNPTANGGSNPQLWSYEGNYVQFPGEVIANRPACNDGNRGIYFFVRDSTNDGLQICANVSGTPTWKTVF